MSAMPEELRQPGKPAILFSHFDASEAFTAMARSLWERGYPVIASVRRGNAAAAGSASAIGCDVAEYDGDGGLRAGLAYYAEHCMQELPAVVVFEPEDGFCTDDALRVAEAAEANPGRLVLASRARNPKLGLFSNLVRRFAAAAFTLVHGRRVGDPWASLRVIPSRYVPGFLALKGDGCKLHLNMLLNLHHMGVKTVSLPVSTQYEYEAGSRLPDRAVDIFKILLLPLKFISASLVATLSDYALYLAFTRLILNGHVFVSLTIGRAAGAIVGYLLNRSVVFKRKNDTWQKELKTALQFALLAVCNYGASWLLVYLFHNILNLHDIVARLLTDMFLFAASYTIQREIIFHRKHPAA